MCVDRDLNEIASDVFSGAPYLSLIERMPPNFIYVNAGSGVGKSSLGIRNRISASKSGQLILVDQTDYSHSPEFLKTSSIIGNQLRFIAGTFEDEVIGGKLSQLKGKADGVESGFGVSAYSNNLDVTTRTALELLEPGGF